MSEHNTEVSHYLLVLGNAVLPSGHWSVVRSGLTKPFGARERWNIDNEAKNKHSSSEETAKEKRGESEGKAKEGAGP
jgi:hypothetical protein